MSNLCTVVLIRCLNNTLLLTAVLFAAAHYYSLLVYSFTWHEQISLGEELNGQLFDVVLAALPSLDAHVVVHAFELILHLFFHDRLGVASACFC